jgi:pyridoxal phosphate enzyme (YggS family)
LQRIRTAELKYHRPPDSVCLLAVSKSQAPTQIATLFDAGQQSMGENYLQEALVKISALSQKQLIWHFIGQCQLRKVPLIAQNFSWVHTVSRLKEAQALSNHRPKDLGALNLCIQVKLDDNPNRSGAKMEDIADLVKAIQPLPHLKLRGLMTIPPITEDFDLQRKYFRLIKNLMMQLNEQGAHLDTLSMGMTHDLEAAIAEGATIVRVGTGIFGPRQG